MNDNSPAVTKLRDTLASVRDALIEIHNAASDPKKVSALVANALDLIDAEPEAVA